ncbi:hypothetical protein HUE87_03275 [Candidatus Sulfurimonas marisnigri]|uniref:Uncharacterized protein n=1 Tax=Candidatus Sulfurimonas marisnigri TaxID=2740405 RepID=A0A7S7RR20_9BACT|nr:hypothetical protein [Candidatus Sulfurimonas marisnigri]QOY55271.1 hypothetical protein HUE87_03275 [Candidatus Sulfurimonas marisnigri]
MQNPFETGHIKNYILLYASVVVIMILFFIASTLFNDVKTMDKKVFNSEVGETLHVDNRKDVVEEKSEQTKFKLLDKAY